MMVWDNQPEQPMDDFDKKLYGRPRIITIPMQDRHLLREIGDMLAGLGRDMMFNATRDGITHKEVASIVANRIDEVNRRICHLAKERDVSMPRRGRRAAENSEQSGNELGTVQIASFAKPQNLYNKKFGK